MSQDVNEKLVEEKFSRTMKWFNLSNAVERPSKIQREQVITRIGPKRSNTSVVFSSQKSCCKREQKTMQLEGYVVLTEGSL